MGMRASSSPLIEPQSAVIHAGSQVHNCPCYQLPRPVWPEGTPLGAAIMTTIRLREDCRWAALERVRAPRLLRCESLLMALVRHPTTGEAWPFSVHGQKLGGSNRGSIAMTDRAFAIANASTVLLICGVMREKVR